MQSRNYFTPKVGNKAQCLELVPKICDEYPPDYEQETYLAFDLTYSVGSSGNFPKGGLGSG